MQVIAVLNTAFRNLALARVLADPALAVCPTHLLP
jgi:hypothetical protein